MLESLQVGLFCISNNIPGTKWLKRFNNGLLVDNNDLQIMSEIINNFTDYSFSKVDAEKNRDIIKNKYSTKIISYQYNKVYENLESS